MSLEGLVIIKLLKKLWGRAAPRHNPTIIPRSQHTISRADINPNALKVLYRLQESGFSAYLVGGGVRDLLLNGHPKDFDVATDAHPEQIKPLFRRCLLIGRRFRLAHVYFGRDIVEVATFRAAQVPNKMKKQPTDSILLKDNAYGTLEEDVWRRDFTINALYYNIADFSIVDYCGGMADLKQKLLRLIGEPIQRYHEDPVRLLRIIRFAGKLGFQIEPKTAAPIAKLAPLLQHVPAARLFDEILKLFHSGKAEATLELMRHYHLFQQLFPQTAASLEAHIPAAKALVIATCHTTDSRINQGLHVSPAFLFASLLWHPLQIRFQQLLNEKQHPGVAWHKASHEVLAAQIKLISIPRRYSSAIREIWDLQSRLEHMRAKQIHYFLNHPRFRAAYDFLVLRAATGENVAHAAEWWTKFQSANEIQRQQLIEELPKQQKRRRKKRVKKHESTH